MSALNLNSMGSTAKVAGLGRFRAAALGLTLLAASGAWAAPTVSYVSTDLADVTVGQDLWRYDYTVTGPIDQFGGVTLSYAFGAYADLAISGSDAAIDATTPVVQPDALFGDGLVTVTWPNAALDASSANLFSVDFIWSGAGTPGAQRYDVFDGSFVNVAGGQTTATGSGGGGGQVPEPAAAALVLAALAALGATRRRKSSMPA